MKKFMKWVLIIVALFIVFGIVASMGSETEPVDKPSEPATSTPEKEPKEEKSGKVTREQFDQIKTGDVISGEGGMTLEEVEKILGPGEKLSESESDGMKMEFYTWKAEGDFGANVTIDFINGKASGKAQFGMK